MINNTEIVLVMGDIGEQELAYCLQRSKRNQTLQNHRRIQFLLKFDREQHIRSMYNEEWILRYKNYDFFQLFRMGKETFEELLSIARCDELQKPYHGGEIPLTAEKALLMTLWWLGKGESLNSIGDRFDAAPSTVHHYANILLNRFVELIPKCIQWPNADEMATIEMQFFELCGYPGMYQSYSCKKNIVMI